ncbi:hypothetical protein Halha_1445 [Halobacteroides halobius DSM 5150]|uniref:Uncharacterized protein n=1 Tax=Halobacteroides halobius (strain ATCC 35273 / DSM 5150 / MD-1) TaxID=748449 RepID=L0KA39_HALHC|nr:hypothetical protein [Halobacteroides halobius]AGB41390.1 hypothetical protein Halha_1445 [Halobacteroides halobius DSM 5150]
MKREQKKLLIEKYMNIAHQEAGISPEEFVQLATEVMNQFRIENDVELYRQINSCIYRKVDDIEKQSKHIKCITKT